ncbi:MAG: tautomerase family protein [Bacteroidetes bacterium]|nr:tautomerase family protein [Bacteroidota bacterium]
MPLVRIEIEKGFDEAYCKTILNAVHEALVECIKIPDHDRRQRIFELEPMHFEHNGRTNQYTIVEITMFKGRSDEAKKNLYASITRRLELNPGIPGSEVIIIIHEPPLQNWGIRGGKPANEVDLGFNITV